ncbi:MAG: hypothetical protein JSW71_02095 [Gemmatimonadota bacterium]|nr:MAG: hypothetical protein JSW71_02095 [Gemmatimonadota bacterium]
MKPVRRLFVSIGAPLILVVGLGAVWAYKQGSNLVRQIESWGHELEHSSEPVVLQVSGFPIISTMYVDGDRVGKLDRVVVLRQAPGGVDSLRIVVNAEDEEHLKHMSGCQLQLDPEALEGTFPTEGWKHIMHCVSETEGLVPFGTVVFEDAGREVTLLLHQHDLPCDHMSHTKGCDSERDYRVEMRRLRDEIRTEVRKNLRIRTR